jgi:MFS family permease
MTEAGRVGPDGPAGPVGAPAAVEPAEGGATGIWLTFHQAPMEVRALLFGVWVNKLGGFLQVFLVLFMTHRGFSDVQASVALGVYGAGSVFGVIAGGSFTDRLGPRRTIALGMIGNAALLIVMLYVGSYAGLLSTAALVGALSQLYRPASAALLAEMIPQQRQVMVFAIYRLALNLGTTVAPLIGAALVAISYQMLFWGEAATSLGYAVIVLLALPRQRPPAPGLSTGGEPGASRDAEPVEPATGYRAVLADHRYVAYIIAMLINCMVYVQYVSTLPLSMRDAGLSTFWYGAMVALNGFVVICFELLMTKLTQHQPISRIISVGFPLMGCGLAMYALPGGVAVFLIGTLMWSVAEIIHGPSIFAYPGKGRPASLRGRYVAAAHAMIGIGTAIGPVVGIALWAQLGRATWLIMGAVCILGLAPALWGVASDPTGPAQRNGRSRANRSAANVRT